MQSVYIFIYILIIAISYALLEIQIEGRHGWASKLPTWKITQGPLVKLAGRPITGFHLYTYTTQLLFFHFPFLFITWSIRTEFLILGMFFLFINLEDFLWFLLNPHYGLKKFTSQHISWHSSWFLGLPTGYWVGTIVSLLLFYLRYQT